MLPEDTAQKANTPHLGLLNVYSTRNLGDAAIYSALARLSPSQRVQAALRDVSDVPAPGLEVLETLPKSDAYISVGGDIFNNDRPRLVTRWFLRNLQELRQDPKHTFLFGQSIPRSCHGLSFQLLAWHLRRLASVCVRDVESHQRLQTAGVNALLSYDTAFALSPDQVGTQAAEQALLALDVSPQRAALISVRLFDSMYPHDNQAFLNNIVALAQALHKRGHAPILVLQADAVGTDSDRTVISAVTEAVPAVKVLNVFHPVHGIAGWPLLLGLLKIAHIVVGVRYHTAVLRLVADRMPFNLYYSNKGMDLSKRLAVPGASVQDFDVHTHLPLIERSAEQDFSSSMIRQHVQDSFELCLEQALA